MRCLSLAFLLCFGLLCEAQKYDNVWIYGTDFNYQSQPWAGNGELTFVNDTVVATDQNRHMAMWHCQQTVCDADGNLQFYTNGMWIMDTSGTKIPNGDSLNFGWLWQSWYNNATSGYGAYSVPEAVFALPKPDDDSSFVLIHELWQNGNFPSAGSICYSVVTRINHKWTVKEKNIRLTPNFFCGFRNIAACKHANGRDWWILSSEENSNCVWKFLLNPDSIFFVEKQCVGDSIHFGTGGKSCFSLDGTKFVNSDLGFGLNVSDFDRCTGQLQNTLNLNNAILVDSGTNNAIDYIRSVEFSPNNRFLYVLLASRIYQYDLEKIDIEGTRDSILNDYFLDTITGNHYSFFTIQTGPNGIMYLGPSTSGRFLNTINNPNGKGDSCDFRFRNIPLTKCWYVGMPYYPNYRLGRLTGSACDTVYSDIKPIYTQTPWLKVFPNPSANDVQFDYNWIEWENYSDVRLTICDVRGTTVMQREVPRYSTRQSFSVKDLAAGVYNIQLYGNGLSGNKISLANCKLIMQ